MVAVLDSEGTFRYVSPSVERIPGYQPRELVGEDALDRVHEADRAQVQEKFVRAVESPVFEESGSVAYVVVSFRDVSDEHD